jgi:hypothetical protein
MADSQILYVERSGGEHEHITFVGGEDWRWSVDDVIRSIEAKTNTFYTKADGKRAEVGVVNGKTRKYIRTYRDGVWSNDLLALPGFPKKKAG